MTNIVFKDFILFFIEFEAYSKQAAFRSVYGLLSIMTFSAFISI